MSAELKSAKYYLKKANYNREEAKELVYKQLDKFIYKYTYGLQYLNKVAFYQEVLKIIDKTWVLTYQG